MNELILNRQSKPAAAMSKSPRGTNAGLNRTGPVLKAHRYLANRPPPTGTPARALGARARAEKATGPTHNQPAHFKPFSVTTPPESVCVSADTCPGWAIWNEPSALDWTLPTRGDSKASLRCRGSFEAQTVTRLAGICATFCAGCGYCSSTRSRAELFVLEPRAARAQCAL